MHGAIITVNEFRANDGILACTNSTDIMGQSCSHFVNLRCEQRRFEECIKIELA